MNNLLQTLYYLETESNRLDFHREPALQAVQQSLDRQIAALTPLQPSAFDELSDTMIHYADLCGQYSFSHGFRLALLLFLEG